MELPAELAGVGAAGASALIAAMMSDGWDAVRDWFGRWLGRGHLQEEEVQLSRLDRDRSAIAQAPPDEQAERAAKLGDAWAVRLQDIVDVDAEAGRRLCAYVEQWRAEHPEAVEREASVRQQATASGSSRIVQVGRDQILGRREHG